MQERAIGWDALIMNAKLIMFDLDISWVAQQVTAKPFTLHPIMFLTVTECFVKTSTSPMGTSLLVALAGK
jgi:hypothetical protein